MAVGLFSTTAGAFAARSSAPAADNPYYYDKSYNPFSVGQCTWYAWGRAYEITGKRPTWSTGNASGWYSSAKSKGYNTGTTPKVGAIACWSDWNHVAVVEKVESNGSPVCSQANRMGKSFYLETMSANTKRYDTDKNGIVVGLPDHYIYLIDDGGTSTTVTTITFTSLTVPDTLTEGTDATLNGSFTSTNSKICGVKAEVFDASSGTVKLTATSSGNFSVWTYGPLSNSKLNTDLDLGKLKAGTYYVKYTVTTQDGTKASKSTSRFTVKAKNCTTHTKGAFQFYEKAHPHYNYWKCSVCGNNFTDGSTVKMASCTTCNPPCSNGHTWGGWTTKAASCGVAGSRTRKCTVCGKVETQTIAALTHNYQLTSSTATAKFFTCANCGDRYSQSTLSWTEVDGNATGTWIGLKNLGDQDIQCFFLVVSYAQEGNRLIALQQKALQISANASTIIDTNIPTTKGPLTWKVFALDRETLAPLLPPLEY